MSGGDEMNGGDEVREQQSIDELAAAYALDALSPEERARFEAEASPAARREAEELADIATLLSTDDVAPPTSMRASVLDAIGAEPQETVGSDTEAEAEAMRTDAANAVKRASALASDASSTEVTAAEALAAEPSAADAPSTHAPKHAGGGTRGPGPAERRARARWRPMRIVGAVAAGAAILTGGIAIGTQLGADSQQQALGAIVAATDAQRTEVEIEGGGTATVVWSNQLGQSVLLFDGLGAAPAGSNYQAWYIDGAGPRSAGVFQAAGGSTAVVLEGQLTAGDVVGVTVEPEGGSDAPTTEPFVVVQT